MVTSPKACDECGRLLYQGETVTITAAEYRDLLARPQPDSPFMKRPSRSTIARDRELGDFIIECAKPGNMFLREIKAACDKRFSPDRSPSLSAIHRFIQATAKGARSYAGGEIS